MGLDDILVTGAGGFVGRHLIARLLKTAEVKRIRAVDRALPEFGDARVESIVGDLTQSEVRDAATAGGVNVLFHLAAVPGGAAEANYQLSRKVNLDATLDLLEQAAAGPSPPRVVYTSTIAVFGADLPPQIDDATPLSPSLTYGAHKQMVEVALADFHRRGVLDAVAVRLPGILARPPAPSGLKSAFLSELFHRLRANQPFTVPVSPHGTIWAMSVTRCIDNLLHGARVASDQLPRGRVITLPALRLRIEDLVAAVAARAGTDPALVRYEPDPALEMLFAAQPPLTAAAAEQAGFSDDGCAAHLVERAFAILEDGRGADTPPIPSS